MIRTLTVLIALGLLIWVVVETKQALEVKK